jgi:hypothetical protein
MRQLKLWGVQPEDAGQAVGQLSVIFSGQGALASALG